MSLQKKRVVIYYSSTTGNTRKLAEYIANLPGVRLEVLVTPRPLPAEGARATGAGANSIRRSLPADRLPALCPYAHVRVLLHGGLEQAGGHLLRGGDTHHGGLRGLCGR